MIAKGFRHNGHVAHLQMQARQQAGPLQPGALQPNPLLPNAMQSLSSGFNGPVDQMVLWTDRNA
jgi:hypothetical protein